MRSNRRKAIIRFFLEAAIAGLIVMPLVYEAVKTGQLDWWGATGGGYFIVLSGLHRIVNTETVNNMLIKVDLGKEDIRTLRKKAQDRQDRRHELDEPPYSGE